MTAVRHLQLDSFIDFSASDRNNEDESKCTDFAQCVLDSAEVTTRELGWVPMSPTTTAFAFYIEA